VPRQIKQCVDIGYGDSLRPITDLQDFIPGADLAFLQHAKVKAGPVMRYKQGGHGRLRHSNPHALARDAWLCHLKERAANPITIADTNFGIGQAVDSKVFAELAKCKIVAPEVALPVAVGVHLVRHYRSTLSSMSGKISLRVSVYV
jgi:hypothetical protein